MSAPPVIRIEDGKVFIDNVCLQIPDEGFLEFCPEVTKLVSECDEKYKNTKYGSEVADRLMKLMEELERMFEGKIDEKEHREAAIAQAKRDEMVQQARLEIIRQGRATPENVNEVVYNMSVKEFKILTAKWPNLSRVYFK